MTEHEAIFDIFRKAYPGTKRGLEVEYDYFVECCGKTHKRRKLAWREELLKLLPALEADIAERKTLKFLPPWKNLKTWLYNRCWTRDLIPKAKPRPKPAPAPFVPAATDEEVKAIMATAPWKKIHAATWVGDPKPPAHTKTR